MGLRRLLAVCGMVAALPIGAWATKISVCSNCDPPITLLLHNESDLNVIQPDSPDAVDGDLSVYVVNLTGAIINELAFQTMINPDLYERDPSLGEINPSSGETNLLTDDFTCDDEGFFSACSVTYDDHTGALNYNFSGVIPPQPPKFEIQLQGWIPNLVATDGTGTPLYSGPNGFPTFQNSFSVVPEPSSVILFLSELLLLVGFLARFGRRSDWKRRFDL